MKKRSWLWRSGPVLTGVGIYYYLLAFVLTLDHPYFRFPHLDFKLNTALGYTWFLLGFALFLPSVGWAVAARVRGVAPTAGPFRSCRHPILASFVLGMVPALALLMRSWLAMTTSIVLTLIFFLMMPREERELAERFGPAYLDYRSRTNVLIPWLPRRTP
jgi:protein-S-isoprenylcysteine O-methyltransferase Ste14